MNYLFILGVLELFSDISEQDISQRSASFVVWILKDSAPPAAAQEMGFRPAYRYHTPTPA